jgi:selenocysteine lyase/cysteine desulfurase
MRVEPLPIRDDAGNPIPLPELDAAVERLAHIAAQQRARVLVHLVDGSKTGLRAPSAAAVKRLQRRLGEALTVVVDAAQMRVGIEQLREYLENGWLVMISGSKFFGGPPFSGALLVPPGIAQRARQMNPVPPGLASYLSAFDVPRSWRSWRAALPATPNVGLLLRWRAALAEMRAFHALDRGVREERLRHLSRRLHDEVRSRRFLEPVRSSLGDREDAATIATFVLKRPDPTRARRVLDFDEAWQLYTWLNRDMAAMLPPYATHSERRAAAIAFHIGQPVRIRWSDGDVAGALRVALGARSLRTDADDLRGVFDKIELILNYWPTLTAQPAVA